MTNTAPAETSIIETYYEILRSGALGFDPDRLRAIVSRELIFEGPVAGRRVGAEPFCNGVAGFITALRRLEMLHFLATPGQAATLYDAELSGGTCRFAEFFELDAGRITALRLVYDPARYVEVSGG